MDIDIRAITGSIASAPSFIAAPGAVIIQARMGSTRLPGKVLKPIDSFGAASLGLLLHRVAPYFQRYGVAVCVATSTLEEDDPICSYVSSYFPGVSIYRGAPLDLLDRYYQAMKKIGASYCIRLTSDCPFIDPEIVHVGLLRFLEQNQASYVSNTLERTLPRGFDFEIFSCEMIEEALASASDPYDREHVTPYIQRLCKSRERIESIKFTTPYSSREIAQWRITLDTEDDYAALAALCAEIRRAYPERKDPLIDISALEIIDLLMVHSEIRALNKHVRQAAG